LDFRDNLRFIKRYFDHRQEKTIASNPRVFYDYLAGQAQDINFQLSDEQPILIQFIFANLLITRQILT